MPVQPPRTAARRAKPGRAAMRGGTILGFMIGLVVGLAVAVVVAIFVTRAPVPFVNKASRANSGALQPRTPEEAPDPNKPLYSKNQPVAPPTSRETPTESNSLLDRIFGRQSGDRGGGGDEAGAPVVASRPSSLPEAPAVKGSGGAGDQAGAAPAGAGYLLQAGAFRGRDEANGMRGKLALLGFEAQVLSAEVNGQTMYRVRVGPFSQLGDMNDARARLADNGIEASVVRQR